MKHTRQLFYGTRTARRHLLAPTSEQISREKRLLAAARQTARRFARGTYLHYLFDVIRYSALVNNLLRLWLYLRRLLMARTVIALGMTLLATLVLSAVYVSALPFCILFTGIAVMAWLIRSRRVCRRMRFLLSCQSVRIIILPQGIRPSRHPFILANARSMANGHDSAVLIVLPHYISGKDTPLYSRWITGNIYGWKGVYLLSAGDYFLVKRRIIDTADLRLTVLY